MLTRPAAAAGRTFEEWLRDDAGHPLGPAVPPGHTLRADGESHRQAWQRVVRADPCAYCGRRSAAGTVDHIEPRSRPARLGRAAGGVHSWLNYAAACPPCNRAKADRPLLTFLLGRIPCKRN